MKLLKSKAVAKLSETAIKAVSNGCGPQGSKIDLVPDDFLGLDLTRACNIHDAEYLFNDDKLEGDLNFLVNMCILNHHDTGESATTKGLRFDIIMQYFKAVYFYGDKAFKKGKL